MNINLAYHTLFAYWKKIIKLTYILNAVFYYLVFYVKVNLIRLFNGLLSEFLCSPVYHKLSTAATGWSRRAGQHGGDRSGGHHRWHVIGPS